MNDFVSWEMQDEIAIVTVDSPPVNAIHVGVRAGLIECFNAAIADDKAKAIILMCAGRTFMAGGDLKEFDEPIADPGYYEAFGVIEDSPKPVIAAMHGTALGGGLEAAISCHYRCADKRTRVGLPEISLGIIPGASGTQRLPRLIGAKNALMFILNMAPIAADEALGMGILDRMIDGDLRGGAIEYARQLLADGAGPRKTSDMEVDTTGWDDEGLAEARKLANRKARNQNAPEILIESINNAGTKPFAEGIAEEKRIGDAALISEEAKALRYIFFAEREVGDIPNLPDDTGRLPFDSIAILGAGTMGGGIAMNFANVGIPVTIVDISDEAVEKGLSVVESNYMRSVKSGRLTEDDVKQRMSLISGTSDYSAIGDKDVVIEAVFEDLELKKKVFKQIDDLAKPGAILATNTSTLDIDAIAAVTGRPESVVGLHFFSPANVMKLLEIVRASKTSTEVLATSVDIGKKIRKVGVVAGVCFGFIGNRMMVNGYHREADQMLLEGASVEQIDRVMYDFGFPMGPWAMHDMAGVNVMQSVLTNSGLKAANPDPYYNVLLRVADMGRMGQRNGMGFYKYEEGNRAPIHDPLIDEVIEEEARKLNMIRSPISDEEVLERCLLGLINEGAKILEEGIAYRTGDIDVIWCFGYGFPRMQGGPMYYADRMGLKTVLEKVLAYQERYGDYWKPAPLLVELAESGKAFAEWSAAQ